MRVVVIAYAKLADAPGKVLNFASKMRFRVAENRATPLRDAAIVALRSTNSDTVAELAKVALHNAGSREAQLAKNALHVLNEAMALLDASKGADDVVASAKRAAATMPSESQRILAAQKEVFLAAAQCYDELDERAAKRLYALESKIGEGGYGKGGPGCSVVCRCAWPDVGSQCTRPSKRTRRRSPRWWPSK